MMQTRLASLIEAVINVAVGFVALRMVNVPMFLCLRRLVAPTIPA